MIQRFFVLLMMMSVYGITCAVRQQPLLITIHGLTQEVTSNSACNKSQWANKAEDACECCLVQTYDKQGTTKSADEIIKACKDAKQCNDASISILKKEKGVKGGSQELLDALYDDAVVLRSMTFDTSLLASNGSFTATSLPQFLAKAYRDKKLSNADFSKAECLKAKNLGTQGGYNTLQLFLVTSTCKPTKASMYIIKGAREGLDEAMKLKEIEHIPGMKEIIAPRVVKDLPSIALPLAYFSYPDKFALHYIAAMPAAKGKSFGDLLIAFRDNQTAENKERLIRAFYILGKETSHFHQRFMQPVRGKIIGLTLTHGDFHPLNIFYDEIGGHCTFIDNETMTRSMHTKVSPYVDMIKLLFAYINKDKRIQSLTEGISVQLWHEIAFKNFIKGYVDAYPSEKRKKVLEELKIMFNDPSTALLSKYESEKLPALRKNYMNPLFEQLITEQKK